jgi:hypothetical protein
MLTQDDKDWIASEIASEIAASEDRIYIRIKDGALNCGRTWRPGSPA